MLIQGTSDESSTISDTANRNCAGSDAADAIGDCAISYGTWHRDLNKLFSRYFRRTYVSVRIVSVIETVVKSIVNVGSVSIVEAVVPGVIIVDTLAAGRGTGVILV